MKKFIAVITILLLCLQCAALADRNIIIGTPATVKYCDEYITLRYEPFTSSQEILRIPLNSRVIILRAAYNGFMQISYGGESGYALAKYLDYDPVRSLTIITDSLNSRERYNINVFLSNFSESSLGFTSGGVFSQSGYYDGVMVAFALEHIWFNKQELIEWGDYFNGNNVRVSQTQIAPVTKKYFNRTPDLFAPTYFDYRDGYYYWQETGGHMDDGYAISILVAKLDGNQYDIWFNIYGAGDNWDNDVCYSTEADMKGEYICNQGYARLYAPDLNDRSGFKLLEYVYTR